MAVHKQNEKSTSGPSNVSSNASSGPFVFKPCDKSREEILAAIRECAARTGYHPSFNELTRITDVSMRRIRQLFGRYSRAVQEAGVEPQGPGRELNMEQLFNDWAGVVRKLGKVPTMAIYRRHARYSVRPLVDRYKYWTVVPHRLQEYAEKNGLAEKWQDVMAITKTYVEKQARSATTSVLLAAQAAQTSVPQILNGSPIYGKPLNAAPLAAAPTNESCVVFLFGALAAQLGFHVLRMQSGFPDCEALRRIDEDRWQFVRIEIEFESKNFLLHDHDPKGCDMIVCWKHNWPECPLEVVELSRALSNQQSAYSHPKERKDGALWGPRFSL